MKESETGRPMSQKEQATRQKSAPVVRVKYMYPGDDELEMEVADDPGVVRRHFVGRWIIGNEREGKLFRFDPLEPRSHKFTGNRTQCRYSVALASDGALAVLTFGKRGPATEFQRFRRLGQLNVGEIDGPELPWSLIRAITAHIIHSPNVHEMDI